MVGIDEDFDTGARLQFRSQLSHRWNSNGTLCLNDLPRICVTAPEFDLEGCLSIMNRLSGLEAADLTPYYDLEEMGMWYKVGEWL